MGTIWLILYPEGLNNKRFRRRKNGGNSSCWILVADRFPTKKLGFLNEPSSDTAKFEWANQNKIGLEFKKKEKAFRRSFLKWF